MTLYLPITTHAPPATTHRELWALGDYAAMASEVLTPLGPILLSASGVRSGDRVLDVAAGSGDVAIPAAVAGAHVVASDLTPKLLRRAQARAAADGLELGGGEPVHPQRAPPGADIADVVAKQVAHVVLASPPHLVPRLFQGLLRPGNQRLSQYRRRPRPDHRTRQRAHRTVPGIPEGRRDGVGVPDFHRPQGVTHDHLTGDCANMHSALCPALVG
jgi:SAM-dependent methyltransferase